MARLCVNIDHVATLREARKAAYPDPLEAAAICERAGAAGITIHLREDRRHIQDRDLVALRKSVKTFLNLEMAAIPEMVDIALSQKPDQVTLVPEKREEVTTEGGLDVVSHAEALGPIVLCLQNAGIPVSLFIDADAEQVNASAQVQARLIELHTGSYCDAESPDHRERELQALQREAAHAQSLGLIVNAGHGLNCANVAPVAAIPGLNELNIGHSIVSRAVFIGMEQAVREMIALIGEASRRGAA